MPQLTAKNHYIPQAYQRAWSDDGVRVPVYRLLVPSGAEPAWRPAAIRRLGMEEHLYTSVLGGTDDHSFETWIRAEIEEPAAEAIDRVRHGRRMAVPDYRRLAYYFAAMDPRTPAAYLTHTAFAALALGLVGVYGVTSYRVAQRTREVGLRIALGADPRHIIRMVVRQGMGVAAAGLAVGLAAALGTTRLMAGLLYGVSPADAVTLGAVAALLLAATLLANYVPARRAARVSPLTALQSG